MISEGVTCQASDVSDALFNWYLFVEHETTKDLIVLGFETSQISLYDFHLFLEIVNVRMIDSEELLHDFHFKKT